MKVRAKSLGYYNNKRQYEGYEFFIKDEKAFSSKWMEVIEAEAKPAKRSRSKKVKSEPKAEVDSNSEVI